MISFLALFSVKRLGSNWSISSKSVRFTVSISLIDFEWFTLSIACFFNLSISAFASSRWIDVNSLLESISLIFCFTRTSIVFIASFLAICNSFSTTFTGTFTVIYEPSANITLTIAVKWSATLSVFGNETIFALSSSVKVIAPIIASNEIVSSLWTTTSLVTRAFWRLNSGSSKTNGCWSVSQITIWAKVLNACSLLLLISSIELEFSICWSASFSVLSISAKACAFWEGVKSVLLFIASRFFCDNSFITCLASALAIINFLVVSMIPSSFVVAFSICCLFIAWWISFLISFTNFLIWDISLFFSSFDKFGFWLIKWFIFSTFWSIIWLASSFALGNSSACMCSIADCPSSFAWLTKSFDVASLILESAFLASSFTICLAWSLEFDVALACSISSSWRLSVSLMSLCAFAWASLSLAIPFKSALASSIFWIIPIMILTSLFVPFSLSRTLFAKLIA